MLYGLINSLPAGLVKVGILKENDTHHPINDIHYSLSLQGTGGFFDLLVSTSNLVDETQIPGKATRNDFTLSTSK